ncbi:MAG: hypothetical protein IPK73_19860 [Candidatus Obscuribacter sp.]|nr:hypothetical protein [Candidatus Obscuribacter sp.]MBK9278110.1 hypothetical protein [Candidatus Obscuribacter sp.]
MRRQWHKLLNQMSVTLLALSCVTVCRADGARSLDSNEKPELPTMLLANPENVYGNAQTQAVERKLLSLLKQAPRPKQGGTNPAKADRIFAEVERLVGTIQNPEELERLAYWCVEADKGRQPNSDLGIVESAFDWALFSLKKKFPAQARARIYELASLVNADAHIAEEIEGHLTRSATKYPSWSITCCYVSILKNSEYEGRYRSIASCVDFNITRQLRQKWYKNWSGKYRYSVQGSFLLQPNGTIRNLKFDKAPDVPGSTLEQRGQAQTLVRQLITTSAPFPALPKFRGSLQVYFKFFD